MEQEVLAALSEDIRTVIGDEWKLDEAITLSTSFADDLELESIEFVALAEKLEERYGRQLDFGDWLAEMELDQIIGLTVGEVVAFIVQCLSSKSTE
ncbi:MAG: acyl carrier protein [Acidobacteriota bacterium]